PPDALRPPSPMSWEGSRPRETTPGRPPMMGFASRSRFLWLALLGMSLAPSRAPADDAKAPRPLTVLFLGDKGHHVPAERAAQLKSHGTGTFDVKVGDAEHPITRGLGLFSTWDETYVHAKHNEEGRHLLEVRDEKGRDEPWTWMRDEGKGRVFYTAYGHDART